MSVWDDLAESCKDAIGRDVNDLNDVADVVDELNREVCRLKRERMYSEEEVLSFGKFCIDIIADFLDGKGDQTDGQEYSMEELFEQFKKKA